MIPELKQPQDFELGIPSQGYVTESSSDIENARFSTDLVTRFGKMFDLVKSEGTMGALARSKSLDELRSGPIISKDELNRMYPDSEKPHLTDEFASVAAEIEKRRIERQRNIMLMNNAPNGFFNGMLQFGGVQLGGGIAGFLADPVNLGTTIALTAFGVPAALRGLSRIASLAKYSKYLYTTTTLASGATRIAPTLLTSMAVDATYGALSDIPNYIVSQEELQDYSKTDVFRKAIVGAFVGAGIHLSIKGLGRAFSKLKTYGGTVGESKAVVKAITQLEAGNKVDVSDIHSKIPKTVDDLSLVEPNTKYAVAPSEIAPTSTNIISRDLGEGKYFIDNPKTANDIATNMVAEYVDRVHKYKIDPNAKILSLSSTLSNADKEILKAEFGIPNIDKINSLDDYVNTLNPAEASIFMAKIADKGYAGFSWLDTEIGDTVTRIFDDTKIIHEGVAEPMELTPVEVKTVEPVPMGFDEAEHIEFQEAASRPPEFPEIDEVTIKPSKIETEIKEVMESLEGEHINVIDNMAEYKREKLERMKRREILSGVPVFFDETSKLTTNIDDVNLEVLRKERLERIRLREQHKGLTEEPTTPERLAEVYRLRDLLIEKDAEQIQIKDIIEPTKEVSVDDPQILKDIQEYVDYTAEQRKLALLADEELMRKMANEELQPLVASPIIKEKFDKLVEEAKNISKKWDAIDRKISKLEQKEFITRGEVYEAADFPPSLPEEITGTPPAFPTAPSAEMIELITNNLEEVIPPPLLKGKTFNQKAAILKRKLKNHANSLQKLNEKIANLEKSDMLDKAAAYCMGI